MDKKKLLIITGGIVGVCVLIVIILLIYNAIFGKTDYSDIENKVLEAAKKYYSDNSSLLPTSGNEKVTTTDSALTQAGYLKSMSELTKDMDGVSCSASIEVSYNDSDYRYTVLLDCGSNYSTKTLTSYIEENETKVYTGSGLYDLNGELVYRGEDPNNYIKYADKMWRIVKIENNNAVLISNEKGNKAVWDDRFNTEKNGDYGINDYAVSRIYDTLTDMYSKYSTSNKSLLVSHSLYMGKRSSSDIYNDGSIEKYSYLENQYIGLLPLYDYINASIDSNCMSAETDSCKNYNYLSNYDYNWWTLTADDSNTYKVFRISGEGIIEAIKASTNGYIREVVYLTGNALYVSGNGTSDNPYIVK